MKKKKPNFNVYKDDGDGIKKLPDLDLKIEKVDIKSEKRTIPCKISFGPGPEPSGKPMANKPEDFMVYHHAYPKEEDGSSGTSIEVLPELIGLPWNEITMCYVLSLRPSAVRVSCDSVTADSCPNRVTIFINNKTDRIIQSISMEVTIPCPEDYCGYDLASVIEHMRQGTKEPYKTISQRQRENGGKGVQIAPGMWIGSPDVGFFDDEIQKDSDK